MENLAERLHKIKNEIERGMQREKCRVCSCMEWTLKQLFGAVYHLPEARDLAKCAQENLERMHAVSWNACRACDETCLPSAVSQLLPKEIFSTNCVLVHELRAYPNRWYTV